MARTKMEPRVCLAKVTLVARITCVQSLDALSVIRGTTLKALNVNFAKNQ